MRRRPIKGRSSRTHRVAPLEGVGQPRGVPHRRAGCNEEFDLTAHTPNGGPAFNEPTVQADAGGEGCLRNMHVGESRGARVLLRRVHAAQQLGQACFEKQIHSRYWQVGQSLRGRCRTRSRSGSRQCRVSAGGVPAGNERKLCCEGRLGAIPGAYTSHPAPALKPPLSAKKPGFSCPCKLIFEYPSAPPT